MLHVEILCIFSTEVKVTTKLETVSVTKSACCSVIFSEVCRRACFMLYSVEINEVSMQKVCNENKSRKMLASLAS